MKFKLFNRNIKIRLLLQFFTTIATMSVTPYLVIYFENRLGTITTGLMFFGVIISTILGSFIGGYYSDRLGRKKIIVFSEFTIFIGYLITALVNSPWANLPYFTFILFVIIHFFTGMLNPTYQAFIIDASNQENRKSIYTFSYWLNNLGIAIGGIIGAFLFKDYIFGLFLGVATINFISFFITLFFITESYIPNPMVSTKKINQKGINRLTESFASIKSMIEVFSQVLTDKRFKALAFANILILSIEEQLTKYIAIRFDKVIFKETIIPFFDFQIDGIRILGILRTENTLIVVTLTALILLIFKKYKDKHVLTFGLLLYTIGYSIISYSNSPWILIIAMLFATIGEMMHIPIKQSFVANIVPDDSRSAYMAVYSLTGLFASMIAGIFIFLGTFFSPIIITSIFFMMGITSITIFYGLFNVEEKKVRNYDTEIKLNK